LGKLKIERTTVANSEQQLSSAKMVVCAVWQRRDPPKYNFIFAKNIRRSTYLPYKEDISITMVT
jgi:hypothetical protein